MDDQTKGPVGANIIGGTVNLAGRDINIGTQISHSDLTQAFQPVIEVIRSANPEKQPETINKLEELKNEVAKGNRADHHVMIRLVDEIVGLVPSALSALAGAFAKPVLSGVAGPLTQFLLQKITGR